MCCSWDTRPVNPYLDRATRNALVGLVGERIRVELFKEYYPKHLFQHVIVASKLCHLVSSHFVWSIEFLDPRWGALMFFVSKLQLLLTLVVDEYDEVKDKPSKIFRMWSIDHQLWWQSFDKDAIDFLARDNLDRRRGFGSRDIMLIFETPWHTVYLTQLSLHECVVRVDYRLRTL